MRLNATGSQAAAAHLRYICRDGVTRDGKPGRAYDARADTANVEAFEARGRDDRHQFRFIVAPQDALQLEDLGGFTRDLMVQMEADVGTRLDWVAVDHWDTDNPHTHLVVRGKDEAGRDLVIAREYIGYGLRRRASELATAALGPRTEREIRAGMEHEVAEDRWTDLDRELQARSRNGLIHLRDLPNGRQAHYRRTLLLGRLRRLATMGLADEYALGRWHLRPDAEHTLRALGERGNIVRTLQRALGREHRELAIFDPSHPSGSIVGRVAGKGFADEMNDRPYVVIDGIDGRVHHVTLPVRTDLAEIPIGGIVKARGVSERTADRQIAALAERGLYRTDRHLAALRAAWLPARDPEATIESHVRRLEALRRAGIVERLAEGIWRVPDDLPARARAYDHQRLGGSAVELLSHLPIEKQVRAIGATWLDQQLVSNDKGLSDQGFGATVRDALMRRQDFLVKQTFAARRGKRLILTRHLLATLRDREIEDTARRIAAETGLAHRPLADGGRVDGVYRRSVILASGRFAMLDDGLGFSLVPWRPVVEKRLGQNVAAVVRGDNISWQFGRKLTRSL